MLAKLHCISIVARRGPIRIGRFYWRDGIRAGRQWGAGHGCARRFTAGERAFGHPACRDMHDYWQLYRFIFAGGGDILRAHREAIHAGKGGSGVISIGRHIFGQHTAGGPGERYPLQIQRRQIGE